MVQAAAIRSRVEPRDVPPIKAARRLGLTEAAFAEALPQLRARGFPSPDPTTGLYDLKAVEAWMDGRSALTGGNDSRDPSALLRARIAGMRGG